MHQDYDKIFKENIAKVATSNYTIFVNSNAPEEIILAILADFKGEDKAVIIRKILTYLKNSPFIIIF